MSCIRCRASRPAFSYYHTIELPRADGRRPPRPAEAERRAEAAAEPERRRRGDDDDPAPGRTTAVFGRQAPCPARPYKSPIQDEFTKGNAEGA
jgi:hypothetical protein